MNFLKGVGNILAKGMELTNDYVVKTVTNGAVNLLAWSNLFQQDTKSIEENKKAVGETLHEMVHNQATVIYENFILPKLDNEYYGEGVKKNKDHIINTVASVIETVLRRLATDSSKSNKKNVSENSKKVPLTEDKNVAIVSTENAPNQVSDDPSQYAASVISQLLRIVKEIGAKEEYKALRDGSSDEKLEDKFFKEVVEAVLLKVFPNKGSDKALPGGARWLLTILSPFGLGWDGIVTMLAGQMKVLLPHYKEVLKSDTIKDQQAVDEVVDPIISKLRNPGNENELLITIPGMKPEHNKVVDGAIRHFLKGDVLEKDKEAVDDTWGFLSSMMKKIIGHFISGTKNHEAHMDKALIKQVGAETLVDTIVSSVARVLHNMTDTKQPLVPGNPVADGMVKNILKKKSKTEDSTTTSFVKNLLGGVINRVIANLMVGEKEPMDNLKDKLDKVFSKIENISKSFTKNDYKINRNDINVKRVLSSQYNEKMTFEQRLNEIRKNPNNEEAKEEKLEFYQLLMIRVATLELLDELISDEEIKKLLPPVFHSLDVKALILPSLVAIVGDIYNTTQQIEGQHPLDENFLNGNGVDPKNKQLLQAVVASKDLVNKLVNDTFEGFEKAAQQDNFVLMKDDKFLNELAKHFFSGKAASKTRDYVKGLIPKVVTQVFANLISGENKNPMENLKGRLNGIIGQLKNLYFHFSYEDKENINMMVISKHPNMKRVLASQYDENTTFEQRFKEFKKSGKDTDYQEFYKRLFVNLYSLEILDEVLSDKEMQKLIPQFLDIKNFIFPSISTYLLDVMNNLDGFDAFEQNDIQAMEKHKLLGEVRDHYVDMGMNIVTDMIKKGVMTPGEKADPIALLINWVTQALVTDPSAKANEGFIENHIKKVVNRVLVYLVDEQPGVTSEEKVGNLIHMITGISAEFAQDVAGILSKDKDYAEFKKLMLLSQSQETMSEEQANEFYELSYIAIFKVKELLKNEENKKVFGDVDVDELNGNELIELWKALLIAQEVDVLLTTLIPDELLKQILPNFAFEIVRPQLVQQLAKVVAQNSTYVVDVVNNYTGLEAFKENDIKVLNKECHAYLVAFRDHYFSMGMEIADELIEKGVMTPAKGQEKDLITSLVNWLAQIGLTSTTGKKDKEFIENHLKTVINRVLVYLFDSQKGETSEEKIGNFMNKIVGSSAAFAQNITKVLSKVLSENKEYNDYKELINSNNDPFKQELARFTPAKIVKKLLQETKNKEIFGDIDVDKLNAKEVMELWGAILIAEQVDSFIKEILPDELLKQILPNFAIEMARSQLVQQLANVVLQNSTYLVDVVKHYNGLQVSKDSDKQAIKAHKGLGKIRDHYIAMGMKIVDEMVEKGVMTPPKEGEKDLIASLVNLLAQIGVTSKTGEKNKAFVKDYVTTLVNRVLVGLLNFHGGKDNPSQEQIGGLISKIVDQSAKLTKAIKDTDFSEVEEFSDWLVQLPYEKIPNNENIYKKVSEAKTKVKKLLEENKKIFGEIDVDKLSESEFIELWGALLIAKHVDAFISEIVPDELLKQVLPEFSIEMIRPLLARTLASTALTQAGPWVKKGAYNSALELFKDGIKGEAAAKFFGKDFNIDDAKTLREGLNKTVARGLQKGIRLGFMALFGETLGIALQWILYVVFFPVAILTQWLILFAIDQIYLKKIDKYVKGNDDISQLMTRIVGKVPALLNAIHSEERITVNKELDKVTKVNKQKAIMQAARNIVDEFKDIFWTSFMRNIISKQIIAQLVQKEEEEKGFFNWLSPMLIAEKKEEQKKAELLK